MSIISSEMKKRYEAKKQNNLTVLYYKGTKVVDSRDVAEMVEKDHDQLMRSIRNFINVLDHSAKLQTADFFIKSSYKNSNNQSYPCYLLTKQGCEMVANKMTGEKGILFTAEYVQAFNAMEQTVKNPTLLSPVQQLQLQSQAILEVNDKVDNVQIEVNSLKDSMPLFSVECKDLQALVKKAAIQALGGDKTKPAYQNKSVRSKVFSDIQCQLRRQFGVKRYEGIKRKDLETAKNIVEQYQLPYCLQQEIDLVNNQISVPTGGMQYGA